MVQLLWKRKFNVLLSVCVSEVLTKFSQSEYMWVSNCKFYLGLPAAAALPSFWLLLCQVSFFDSLIWTNPLQPLLPNAWISSIVSLLNSSFQRASKHSILQNLENPIQGVIFWHLKVCYVLFSSGSLAYILLEDI